MPNKLIFKQRCQMLAIICNIPKKFYWSYDTFSRFSSMLRYENPNLLIYLYLNFGAFMSKWFESIFEFLDSIEYKYELKVKMVNLTPRVF